MTDYPKYPHDLLPFPVQDGYGMTPVSPLLRTQMTSGRAKQRRRYNSTPTIAKVNWLFLERAHSQLFEAWFQEVLFDGASWFEMQLKTPQGTMPYICRFTDIYDGPTLESGSYWRFSADLELRKRPVIQGGWGLYYPEALRYMDIIDRAINQQWPESRYQTFMDVFDTGVNQEWPAA